MAGRQTQRRFRRGNELPQSQRMAVWGAAQNDPGDWPFDSKHLETRPLKPSGLAGSRQLIARPGSPASPLNHSGGKGDLHSASRSKSRARATSREEIRFPIPIAGRGRSRLRPAICGAIVRKNSSTRPAATNCPNSVPRCAALEKWEASQSRRSSTQTGQPDMPGSAIASGCIDFVLSPEDIAQEIVRIAHAASAVQ